MTKKHTAVSLARYLGGEVRVCFSDKAADYTGELITINQRSQDVLVLIDGRIDSVNMFPVHMVYPILYSVKTLAKRPEEFKKKIYGGIIHHFDEINQNFSVYYYSHPKERSLMNRFVPDALTLERLIGAQFGAIPCCSGLTDDSPTGYIDLYGYPCICGDEE